MRHVMNIPDDVFDGPWLCQRVWQAGGRWYAMYRSTVDNSVTRSHIIAKNSPNLPRVGQLLKWVLMTLDDQ